MKLIKISTNHYIIVDDSEIKEGDWYIDDTKSIRQSITSDQSYWSKRKEYKKITNSTQPIDTIILKNRDHSQSVGHYYGNGGQLSLQEVKELIGEVDVEKKAKENYIEPLNKQGEKRAQLVGNGGLFGFNKFKKAFKKGYNQALEDNKDRKYTEEDMKNALFYALNHPKEDGVISITRDSIVRKSIQSLQPKTEWKVEIVDGKLKLK